MRRLCSWFYPSQIFHKAPGLDIRIALLQQ
jgi:hypothetical protein